MSAGVSPVFAQIFGPAVRENISVGSSHSVHPEPPWEFDDPTSHIGGCLQSRAMSSPVIKIATNSNTFRAMPDNMDVNAGAISDGESTVQQVGRQIFDSLLEIASGRQTCAERLGHKEFVPWRIGPVM